MGLGRLRAKGCQQPRGFSGWTETSAEADEVRAVFDANSNIASFDLDQFVTGQRTPDDPWDGTSAFSSSDLVTAFTDGGFETGPRGAVAAVPEPTSALLLMLGIAGIAWLRRPATRAGDIWCNPMAASFVESSLKSPTTC